MMRKGTSIMGKIKSNKKNIIIAAALITVLAIGSTFAYFVDRDYELNCFTVGTIDVEVQEPNWNPEDAKNILPKEVIPKDPQVKNNGTNEAYIFVEVSVQRANVTKINDDGTPGESGKFELFSFDTNDVWTLVETTHRFSNTTEYVYAYTDSSGKAKKLGVNETTSTLFDEVKFINAREGSICGMETGIEVTAIAIQADNLGTDSPNDIYNIILNGVEEEN